MSDGPHRSLPMRHGWKKLDERADKPAFEPQHVADAVGPALEQDFRVEVPNALVRGLRDFCADAQPSLFEDQRAAEVDALRRSAAGLGSLAGVLVDYAVQA